MDNESPYYVALCFILGLGWPLIVFVLAGIWWNGPSSLKWWHDKAKSQEPAPDIEEWPIKNGRYR